MGDWCRNFYISYRKVSILLYACMYLMIGKGHIAQRDNIWAKIDGRAKSMGKYTSQVVF